MTPEEATKQLFEAAKSGNLEAAKEALAADAAPTAKDHLEQTPLHWAVWRDHIDLAQLLLDNGADPNARDDRLRTPLHFAVERGNSDLVRLLLKKGADVNAKNQWQETPLNHAAGNGYADLMKMLQGSQRAATLAASLSDRNGTMTSRRLADEGYKQH